jgi:hypothetical protein
MKKEQRDITLLPTRGQPSNAIFYPDSATGQFSVKVLLIWVWFSCHGTGRELGGLHFPAANGFWGAGSIPFILPVNIPLLFPGGGIRRPQLGCGTDS